MYTKRKRRDHKNFKQEKLLKAEHRNNFLKRIKALCASVDGGEDVYHLIPKSELDLIYRIRFLPFQTIALEKNSDTEEIRKTINHYLPELLKQKSITVSNSGYKINYFEFLTIALTFFYYLERLKPEDFREAAKVKMILPKFLSVDALLDEAMDELHLDLEVFSFCYSRLDHKLFWLTHRVENESIVRNGLCHLIEIHSHNPEKVYARWDNYIRPAIRVCWCFEGEGVRFSSIMLCELGIKGYAEEMRLDVYIQSHALIRLYERIDCVKKEWVYFHLFYSLRNIKSCRSADNSILIEYRLFNSKVGYLLVDIHGGNVIIRTFLFITQNGTPEGKKLSRICKLGKLDKSFLGIDKLSTFMTKDFGNSSELSNIFIQADCKCLVDIYQCVGNMCIKEGKHSTIELMIKYLGLNSKLDFLTEEVIPKRLKMISELETVVN